MFKNFKHLLPAKKGLDKQCSPKSDSFWKSSLIKVFPICYSDQHFVNSSPENQHFIWQQKDFFLIFEHLLYAQKNTNHTIHTKGQISHSLSTIRPYQIFRFSSPPAPMKYKQIKKKKGWKVFSEKPSTPIFYLLIYKQIKKKGVEGFFRKTFHPNFLFAYKRKKCLKKAEKIWCIISCQHFCKKNFFFYLLLNLTI